MSFAYHVERRPVLGAGDGLFTTDAVRPGKEIFSVENPMAYVLDSSHLQDTCANCLGGAARHDEIDTMKLRLKRCKGCRVVRYCGEACHRESFKLGHRYECKIYSALYPNVIPNTVRLVLRLLLRRQNRSLSDKDWSAFLSLQSHVTDFQAQQTTDESGLTVWETIELMSQAAAKYSGTRESLHNIQGMLARVLVNTHTLTTPTLDPLGLCLSPNSALLNHSCTPNSHIVFLGQRLTLRSLKPIESGSELTIAYIDTTQMTVTRKSELQTRYFFACTCPLCGAGTTNDIPDRTVNSKFSQLGNRALRLQAQAIKLSPSEAATQLKSALELLSECPPYRQPYATIQHNAFINAVASQEWLWALKYALKAYFLIEPVHYPLSWHPVRVVRKWVLLRLVIQIAGTIQGDGDLVKALDHFKVDWRIVIEGLWKEVSDGVELSHGGASSFAEEVKTMGQECGIRGTHVSVETTEREWVKLRKIADEIES